MKRLRQKLASCRLIVLPVLVVAVPAWSQPSGFPHKTGVQDTAIQHPMDELSRSATIAVKGDPDWLAAADDAVWITTEDENHVIRLDARTNQLGPIVTVSKPCSGLAVGFGSVWVPSCGDHTLVRVDQGTGGIQARIPATPADDEGGVDAGAGSVWLVTSAAGELTRVDATTNKVVARISIRAGSFNPLFAAGSIWVTSNAGNSLLRIDPASNKAVASIPIGPKPRFLASGAGSIWVLNQGDGSISRVDAHTGKLLATIQAGIPGHGGEIAFGGGFVWATETEFPLTQIDPRTNKVVSQWHGEGGDSVRFAFGTVWLTNLKGEKVWRIPVPSR